jgi:N-alpha-acetyltransferase 30
MKLVKQLVDPELSEPYSIFTYRLFLTPWPHLCHFCYVSDKPVGVVVCKVDDHKSGRRRGYIGMIVVIKEYRKYGIGIVPTLCFVRLLVSMSFIPASQKLKGPFHM